MLYPVLLLQQQGPGGELLGGTGFKGLSFLSAGSGASAGALLLGPGCLPSLGEERAAPKSSGGGGGLSSGSWSIPAGRHLLDGGQQQQEGGQEQEAPLWAAAAQQAGALAAPAGNFEDVLAALQAETTAQQLVLQQDAAIGEELAARARRMHGSPAQRRHARAPSGGSKSVRHGMAGERMGQMQGEVAGQALLPTFNPSAAERELKAKLDEVSWGASACDVWPRLRLYLS